jgi:hypothetical protein
VTLGLSFLVGTLASLCLGREPKARVAIIILFAHTFQDLQPLDISYFKPFKTAFQKVKDAIMASRNYMEPNKITLIALVDQALKQTLIKRDIKFKLRASSIWPLDSNAMNNKI